jgi:hypothetical protein
LARRYTERDVLDYLDNCVAYYPKCFFMDLEYPYFYSVNSRLSLFADDANWAIAFEESGYANRAFEIELALNFFGRDLRNLKLRGRYNEFAYNSQYFTLVAADALDEVSQDFEKFSPPAARVKVRVRYVGLPPAMRATPSGSPPSSPATTPNPSPSPTSPATQPSNTRTSAAPPPTI